MNKPHAGEILLDPLLPWNLLETLSMFIRPVISRVVTAAFPSSAHPALSSGAVLVDLGQLRPIGQALY